MRGRRFPRPSPGSCNAPPGRFLVADGGPQTYDGDGSSFCSMADVGKSWARRLPDLWRRHADPGGVGTPIGTPPNLIGIGMLDKLAGHKILFFRARPAQTMIPPRLMNPMAKTASQKAAVSTHRLPIGPKPRRGSLAVYCLRLSVLDDHLCIVHRHRPRPRPVGRGGRHGQVERLLVSKQQARDHLWVRRDP